MTKIVTYRIYDVTDDEILAEGIPSEEQAREALALLQLNYPHNQLELEVRTTNTVRPGFGRDPDLH